MSQMSEGCCFYLDSAWTQRDPRGSCSLVLREQIAVPHSHVMYLDDVSVIGNIPMVHLTNNRLLVGESQESSTLRRPSRPVRSWHPAWACWKPAWRLRR